MKIETGLQIGTARDRCVFWGFFYSFLFYVDTNFLFTNLQIVLSI